MEKVVGRGMKVDKGDKISKWKRKRGGKVEKR